MNRQERRRLEKQLGLHKHRSRRETREQMFQRWEGNRESGKRMEDDMRNKRATMIQEQEDQKMSDVINSMAEYIAKTKNIPVVDAMVEAQEQYGKSN